MKEYKHPVIKTLELKADLEFAMVTSNPGGNLKSDTIFGGTNTIIDEVLD